MLIERKGDCTYLIDTRCSSVWIRVNHLLMLEEGRLVSVWFICVSERSIGAAGNCLINAHNILEMLFESLVLEKDPNAMNAAG